LNCSTRWLSAISPHLSSVMGAQYLPVGSRHRTSNSSLPNGQGKDCSNCPRTSREGTQPPQRDSVTSSRKSATTLIIPLEALKWNETIPIHLRLLKKYNPYAGSSSSSTTFEHSASTMPPMVEFDAYERQRHRRKGAVSCTSLTTGTVPASYNK